MAFDINKEDIEGVRPKHLKRSNSLPCTVGTSRQRLCNSLPYLFGTLKKGYVIQGSCVFVLFIRFLQQKINLYLHYLSQKVHDMCSHVLKYFHCVTNLIVSYFNFFSITQLHYLNKRTYLEAKKFFFCRCAQCFSRCKDLPKSL